MSHYFRSIFYMIIVLNSVMLIASDNTLSSDVPSWFFIDSTSDLSNESIGQPSTNITNDTLNEISNYIDAIEQVESESGVYGQDISQQLIGLGLSYQTINKHDEAVDIFKRALHLQRVNEGLYSLNQLSVIKNLIHSYSELGNWNKVNKTYKYYYWLHVRNYEKYDPEMLDITTNMAKWHLKAYELELEESSDKSLFLAVQMYQHALDIIIHNFSETDLRLVEPLKGLIAINYLSEKERGMFTYDQKGYVQDHNIRTFHNNQNNFIEYSDAAYVAGRNLYAHLLAVYRANALSDKYIIEKTMAAIGDWHLIFKKRIVANKAYKITYDQMIRRQSGDQSSEQTLDKLFGSPLPLPIFSEINLGTITASGLQQLDKSQQYALVNFDVNKRGDPRNIKILESNPPDNTHVQNDVLRRIKKLKFRPRIVEGNPVMTENIQLGFLVFD